MELIIKIGFKILQTFMMAEISGTTEVEIIPMILFIGFMRPLKMLPLVLFEIVYKVAWILIVTCPLSMKNELIGSLAKG